VTNQVRILLIEDNPNDVELALHAFDRHNLSNEVRVCRDGEEALAFLFRTGEFGLRGPETEPQVILLDLKLPKIDGIDVLRAIKADDSLSLIPVVVLTASDQDRDLVETYDLGVNSYIVKPVDFDQFTAAVQAIGFYWALLNKTPEQPRIEVKQ
jgi:two-component system response regulator